MKKHIISLIMLLVLVPFRSGAVTVNNVAGNLHETVENPGSVGELTVNGEINASDMAFIAREMSELYSLNLSNATITESHDLLVGGTRSHAANTIPATVFAGMKIRSLTLPSTPGLVIGKGAFAGTAVMSIIIPSTVSKIDDGAFAGCYDLKTINCGAEEIGVGAFSSCPSLETVVMSSKVDIPENCFYNCPNLKVLSGSEVTGYGKRSLSGCSALFSASFGANLRSIGDEAFLGTGLEKVDLTKCASLDSIGSWAFSLMPNLKSLAMGNVDKIGEGLAFGCPNLKDVTTSVYVTEIPSFAFSKSQSVSGDNLVPEGITYIGRYALSGLSRIEEIHLPETIEKLDDHAMENMGSLLVIESPATIIPQLGEDVWAGIDQSKVRLIVPVGYEEAYQAADQWQNFIIYKDEPEPEPDPDSVIDATVSSALHARFSGDDLIVVSEGAEIEQVLVYNTSGQLLVAVAPQANEAVIETAGLSTRLYIINATLSDGRVGALKLSK